MVKKKLGSATTMKQLGARAGHITRKRNKEFWGKLSKRI